MEPKKKTKRLKALGHLKEALQQYKEKPTDLCFLTVSKAFENLIENEWRDFKKIVEEEGVEASSPKAAIKEAARLKHITDPEVWLDCLEARNNSVHDYFGISEKEYVELAKKLLTLASSREC